MTSLRIPGTPEPPQDPADVYDRIIGQRVKERAAAPTSPLAAPQEPDPYDQVIAERGRARDRRLTMALSEAAKADPKLAGEAQQLGVQFGLDPLTVERNIDKVRRLAVQRNARQATLAGGDSVLARMMGDPHFARVAADDVDNLGFLEGISKNYQVGRYTHELGILEDKAAFGAPTPAELQRLQFVRQQLDALPESASGLLTGLAKTIGQVEPILPEALAAGTAASAAAATMAAAVTLPGPQVLASPVTIPGAAATGFVGGFSISLFNQSSRVERGLAFAELRKLGVEEGAARHVAGAVGAVNGLLEVVGAGALANPIVGAIRKELAGKVAEALTKPTIGRALGKAAGQWALGVGGEITTETLQETANILGEAVAGADSGTPVVDRLAGIIAETFKGTAILGSFGPTVALAHDAQRARRAEESRKVFEQIAQGSIDSKVRERNPDQFQRFVAATTDGTPVETIYVDGQQFAEVLQQAGLTPKEIERVVPGLPARVAEAAAAGGDVQVQTSEYAAKIAGTPLDAALRPHVRFDPEGMSLAEAETFQQGGKDKAAEVGKQVDEKMRSDEAFATSARQVERGMAAELIVAGRPKHEAEAGAKLWRAYVETQAARLGVTPEQFAGANPLRVVPASRETPGASRPEPSGGDARKDTGAETIPLDTPANITDGPVEAKPPPASIVGAKWVHPDGSTFEVRATENGPQWVRLDDGTFQQPGGRALTETPEFRAWFGESKVRDPEGKPLRMFHGTSRAGFESFETYGSNYGLAGTGSYFTESPEVASSYTTKGRGEAPAVYPVFLSIKNPIDLDAPADVAKWKEAFPGVEDFHEGGQTNESWFRAAEAQMQDGEVLRDEAGTIMQEKLVAMGFDGLTHMGGGRVSSDSQRHRVYVAFDPEQIKSATGNRGTFDPNDPNILRSGARGDFNPARLLIRLTKEQDSSTFLHEAGHAFLTILERVAAAPNAPPQIVADFQALLDWFGVKDIATWQAMTLEQQREHHEAFAYNFELYLHTGEAPAPTLRNLFRQFKAWLARVYHNIRGELNAVYRRDFGKDLPALTPEVRAVMDRMLASEQQAARAAEVRGLVPAFQTQEQSGMDDAAWAKYQADQGEQAAVIGEALLKESLAALAWTERAKGRVLKERQRARKADRKALRAEVAAEVAAEGVYRARAWLRTGKMPAADGTTQQGDKDPNHRLRTEDVRAVLGDEAGKLKALSAAEGVRPDDVAAAFGFETGEQLVRALAEAPPLDDAVNARTDERALAKGLMSDEQAANLDVASKARNRFAAAELRALTRATEPKRVMERAAREAALQMLERKTLREINPRQHAAAERRAAAEAAAAVKKGDTVAAVNAKRQQLVQGYLAREATAVRAEWEAAKRQFAKLYQRDEKLAKTRDVNLVGAARAILAAYKLGPGPTQARPHLDKVAEYDDALHAELLPMVTRATEAARDFQTMPLADLRELRDAVMSLWERSGREKEVEFAGKKESRDEVVEKLLAAFETFGIPDDPTRSRSLNESERRQRSFGSLKAGARHVESWALEADRGTPGDVHRYLFDMIRKPFDAYMVAKNDKVKALHDEVRKLDWSGGKIHVPELGYTFTSKEHLLGALLHMGNPSNLRINGVSRGWLQDLPDGTLDAAPWWKMVRRLVADGVVTKRDVDLLQYVWDMYESTKKDAQRAHFENYGHYFEEVEAQPFTLVFPDGTSTTYRGGYVPAQPDQETQPAQPGQVSADGITEAARAISESRPSTGKGFTITRTGIVRPLEMSIQRQAHHLDAELRFIHLQRPGRDLSALLRHKRVREAIHRIDPSALTEMFQPWLADTLLNRVMAPGGNPTLNKFLVALRRNTALAFMFGSVTNAAQQITGLASSALYVKVRHLRAAASLYARERGTLATKIIGQSAFMELRLTQQIGQLVDDMDVVFSPTWLGDAQKWTQRHAYFLQRAMQNPVDIITWQGGFEQAVANGKSEADAVRDADAAVRLSQGSGTAADLSKFERGSALARTVTQFGSFWFATFNTLAQRHGAERAKAAAVIVMFVGVAASAIKKALEGGWDDEDEDGSLWDDVAGWTFGESLQSGAAAAVPVIGPGIMRMLTGESAGRLSLGASYGAVESAFQAVKGTVRAWTDAERDFAGKNVRDLATLFTLLLGLPVTLPARPASYGLDVGRGEVRPTGPVDLVRGLVTGRASPASTR